MVDVRRQLFERIVDAMTRRDWDALQELHHPDFIDDVPQARERIVGFANLRKILENYPAASAAQTSAAREWLPRSAGR